jgi:hypothetical protein
LDATIIIPFGSDSPDRLRNLDFVVDYLRRHFPARISIGESGPEPTIEGRYAGADYTFVRNSSGSFHRTKILNQLLRKCSTRIVVNHDADVFFEARAYHEAYETIALGHADVVLPYGGRFLDVHPGYIDLLKRGVVALTNLPGVTMSENSVGGAVFFDRGVYIAGGMENEHFVAYTPEDLERIFRFATLGYRVRRITGTCYHLHHARTANSTFQNPYFNIGVAEHARISRLSKAELAREIAQWSWVSASA